MHTNFVWKNLVGRYKLGVIGIDYRIMLKYVLKK